MFWLAFGVAFLVIAAIRLGPDITVGEGWLGDLVVAAIAIAMIALSIRRLIKRHRHAIRFTADDERSERTG